MCIRDRWHDRRDLGCLYPHHKFHFAGSVSNLRKKSSKTAKCRHFFATSLQTNDLFERSQCIIWQKEVHHSALNFRRFEKHCCRDLRDNADCQLSCVWCGASRAILLTTSYWKVYSTQLPILVANCLLSTHRSPSPRAQSLDILQQLVFLVCNKVYYCHL